VRQYPVARNALQSGEFMDFWLVVGIFLLGCGLGSLVTAALYLAQLRKVRSYLHTAHPGSQNNSQPLPDAANRVPDKRSA
jgi:hypothetical protein